MNRSTLLHLLEKFRQGACTPAEEQLLYQWLDLLEQDAADEAALSPAEKKQIRQNMLQQIFPPAATPAPRMRPAQQATLRWAAAALVLILGAGAWFLLRPQREAPVWITRHNTGNTVQQLLLPDSSAVMLAPHTTLQYPSGYTGATRTVRLLRGRALFDTHTDPRRPFIVESNDVRTTVLGTSFSVASYKGLYACRVTVMTGKVKVNTNGNAYSILTPSQRLTIADPQANPVRDTIRVSDALAWTRGELILRNANLRELMSALQEHYGIPARTALNPAQGSYTVRLQAAMPLPQVLDIIGKISYKPKIHFSMQQDQLIIY